MTDQAQGLRDLVAERGVQVVPVDYKKLWEDLKSTLEAEALGRMKYDYAWIGPGKEPARSWGRGYEGDEKAQAMLDRMEQAETLARFNHA